MTKNRQKIIKTEQNEPVIKQQYLSKHDEFIAYSEMTGTKRIRNSVSTFIGGLLTQRSILKRVVVILMILVMALFSVNYALDRLLDPQKLLVEQTDVDDLEPDNYDAGQDLKIEMEMDLEVPSPLNIRAQAVDLLREVEADSTNVSLKNLKSRDFSDQVALVDNGGGAYEVVVEQDVLPPGQYTLTIDVIKDGIKYTKSEVFTYGVLAINTNKVAYLLDEVVKIDLGVLDPYGFTICNGDLLLEVEDPEGIVSEIEAIPSGECDRNNVTNIPDYSASYLPEYIGEYSITLTNQENGISTTNTFDVEGSLPYSIERIGPTRIFPFVPYPMEIRVKAYEPFLGQIIEKVPFDFEIDSPNLVKNDEGHSLVWDVDMQAGEELTFSYFFDAPDVSPELFFVGPLSIGEYTESRTWQIASDADGSGSISVDPTTAGASSTGNTFTFTFDPSEDMNSGEIAIKVPTTEGWSTPQGNSGTAGYVTVSGSGNATLGEVLARGESLTEGDWTVAADDPDACNSLVAQSTNFYEGTLAIRCGNNNITAPDDTDSFSWDHSSTVDWSSYDQISFWFRSNKNLTSSVGAGFAYDDTADMSSPIMTYNLGTVSVNTWTYFVVPLTGTRTAVKAFGFYSVSNTGFDDAQMMVDYVMIGSNKATFPANGSDSDINVDILDLASTETVTITYGSGGGTSGVTAPSALGADEFTTRTRTNAAGTLTSISSQPTITVEDTGITISGTCKQSDNSTNCTDVGTVRVAVNGTLQVQTQTTVAGTWSIADVAEPASGDVITVFIDGADEGNEAVAVTTYDGSGDIAGMELILERLSIGNSDNRTITNANLSAYDNSVSADEDIFYDISAGNDLTMTDTGKTDPRLYIKSGNTYRPASDNTGNVTVKKLDIVGTLTADGNTIELTAGGTPLVVSGTFNENTSTFKYSSTTATTITAETYYNLNLQPSSSGSPTYTLASGAFAMQSLTIGDGTNVVTVNWDTNDPSISVGGSLTLNANSTWTKSASATLTFAGATSPVTWTDSTTFRQNVGNVVIDGSSGKELDLGSSVKVTKLHVTSGDTLDMNGSNTMTITGSGTGVNMPFIVDGSFTRSSGTVEYESADTTDVENLDYSTLKFNWGGTTFNSTGSMTIYTSLHIGPGIFEAGSYTYTLVGTTAPFVVSGGTFNEGTSTVNYTASGTTNVLSETYYNLQIGNVSQSSAVSYSTTSTAFTVTNDLTIGSDLGSANSTFNVNLGDPRVDVNGDLIINARGTYSASSNTTNYLSVAGDIINNGTFTHNSGKVVLDSAADTSQTLSGATTFYNLEATTGDRIIYLTHSQTFSIAANGSLTLNGTDCTDLLRIRSSTSSTQTTLSVDSSATKNVAFVDIQDINLTTSTITATNSVNSGNNGSNWTIAGNACLGTSSNDATTGHSFQRKVIHDDENERYWSFYHDGSEIEIRYSSDNGTTWSYPNSSTGTRLPYNTNDFTVTWKSVSSVEYIFLAVADGGDIKIRQGVLSTNDITWDTDVSVALNSTGTYSKPTIDIDSTGYMWIGATFYSNPSYTFTVSKLTQSANTDPSTWTWSEPTALSDASSFENVYGILSSLSNDDMYATFIVNNDLQGCKWDDSDSAWENSEGAGCLSTVVGGFSEATYFSSLSTGLIGYWKMNESSWNGTTDEVADASGNAMDGTRSGNATTASTGIERAGTFDGTDDYVNIPDDASLDITGSFTISAWIRPTGSTTRTILAKRQSSGASGYAIALGVNNEVYCQTESGSLQSSYTANSAAPNDVWSHVTVVRDGTSCRVYVDGVDATSTAGSHSNPATNAYDLRIGTKTDGTDDFNGKIDEVRLYSRALSTEEVAKIYEYLPESVNIDDASNLGPTYWGDNVVRASDGTLYMVNRELEVWSSDNGVDWVKRNGSTLGRELAGGSSVAIDSSDNLYLVFVSKLISDEYKVFAITFNTTTYAWGSYEYVSSNTASGALDYAYDIELDSNDKPHVIASVSTDTPGIKNVKYFNKVSGSWTSAVTISFDDNYVPFASLEINEDDIPIVVNASSDTADLQMAIGNANNATSFTIGEIDQSVNVTNGQQFPSSVHDENGNLWVVYVDATTNYITLAKENETSFYAGSLWNFTTATTKSDVGYKPSIVQGSDGCIYVLYENDQDDIAYDIYDPGTDSWVGETVLHTGTFSGVRVKSSTYLDNFSSTYIDYVYTDGTDLFYANIMTRPRSESIDNASDFGAISGLSPHLVRISTGDLYAFLNDGGNCEIWASLDQGKSWSQKASGTTITCDTYTNSGIAAAVDSHDNINLVYSSGANLYYRVYDVVTSTFGAAESIQSTGSEYYYPAIAINKDDTVSVAWDLEDGGAPATTYLQTRNRTANGTWSTTTTLESASGAVYSKALTINEDNNPEIAYIIPSNGDLKTGEYGSLAVIGSVDLGNVSIGVDANGHTYIAIGSAVDTRRINMAVYDETSWTFWSSGKLGSDAQVIVDYLDVSVLYINDKSQLAKVNFDTSTWTQARSNLTDAGLHVDSASDFGAMTGTSRQIVKASDGDLYAFLNDGGSCEIWKSADFGLTWSEQNNTNNPSCSTYGGPAMALDSAGYIHLVYYEYSAGSNIKYIKFNTANDTFGSAETVYSAGYLYDKFDVSIDSNDIPHISFIETNFDSSTFVPKYTNRVGGTWDATPVTLESLTSSSSPTITISDEDIAEISYINFDAGDLTIARGNQNDASSFSLYDLDTNVNATFATNSTSIAVDALGHTWIAYVDENGTTDYISLVRLHDGVSLGGETYTVLTNSNGGTKPAITISGNDIYVFYENDNGTTSVSYDRYSNGSWLGETDISTANMQDIKPMYSYNNAVGLDRAIPLMYSNGTDIWAEHYILEDDTGEVILDDHGALQDVRVASSYVNNYDSTGTASVQTNTYYFDASDAAATDPNSVWTNDGNAFDGSISTSATTSTAGSTSSNFLKAEGTNAPSGTNTITSVKARMYSFGKTDAPASRADSVIYSDNLTETLGTVTGYESASGASGWGAYTTLSAPTGGWSWSAVQALETKVYFTGSPSTDEVYKLEVLVQSTSSTTRSEMDYIYSDGTDVFYNSYSESQTNEGSKDDISTGAVTPSNDLSGNFSVISQSISTVDYLHLVFADSNGDIHYIGYDGSWDLILSTIDSTDANGYPIIASNSVTNDLYMVFKDNSGGMSQAVATYSVTPSWSWGSPTTISTGESDDYTNLNINEDGYGKVGLIYSAGETSPYNVGWKSILDAVPNEVPSVTSVSVNGGNNINLTENTTTTVNWTATVTDADGYSDLVSATGKLYRSGAVGADQCTPNNNSCYSDASCALSGCSGNSCTATCSVDMYFHADATDASSTQPSEYWRGWVQVTDSEPDSASAYSAVNLPDVNSLAALSINSSLNYGVVLAGASSAEQSLLVTNTGNVAIDTDHYGSNMCTNYPTCSGSTIAVGNQEYSMTNFTYGSGTDLTGSGVRLQFNLVKPTSSPSNATKYLYWRLGIPSGQAVGSYSGVNSITAINDNL